MGMDMDGHGHGILRSGGEGKGGAADMAMWVWSIYLTDGAAWIVRPRGVQPSHAVPAGIGMTLHSALSGFGFMCGHHTAPRSVGVVCLDLLPSVLCSRDLPHAGACRSGDLCGATRLVAHERGDGMPRHERRSARCATAHTG